MYGQPKTPSEEALEWADLMAAEYIQYLEKMISKNDYFYEMAESLAFGIADYGNEFLERDPGITVDHAASYIYQIHPSPANLRMVEDLYYKFYLNRIHDSLNIE